MSESPAEHVRRPKIDTASTTLGLDRMELGAFPAQAAAAGPVDHALACLLGLLGLRVSEACRIDIENLGSERGHRTVTVLGLCHGCPRRGSPSRKRIAQQNRQVSRFRESAFRYGSRRCGRGGKRER